jgi:transmembrane sensor
MTHMTSKSELNTQIYDEACEWLVHFRAGDADDDAVARQKLDEWLRRSPEHVRAYLEVSAIWEDIAFHDTEGTTDAGTHIARARAEHNVHPITTNSERSEHHYSSLFPRERRGEGSLDVAETLEGAEPVKRPRFAAATIALAASLLLATATAVIWDTTYRGTYSTEIGEQRTLTLDDGSIVQLNARSRLRVHFDDQHRSIELLAGQALFRVAKDPTRPFIVTTGDTQVRAVGTQFDVNRRRAATTLTVIEGKVAVENSVLRSRINGSATADPTTATRRLQPQPDKTEKLFVSAGEQLIVTPQAITTPRPANIAAATAWTQQRLVFDSAPLSEVAEEFNRYNTRPIVIRDNALENFGVIGVFSSADPASLLAFLRAQPEIAVFETASEVVITRK